MSSLHLHSHFAYTTMDDYYYNNNNHHGGGGDNNRFIDDPFYYGGPNGSIATFLMIHNVKLAWVAFFALWVYWGLIWFLRHAFGDGHQGSDYAGGATRDVQEEQQENTTRGDTEATAGTAAGATAGAGIRSWLGRRRVKRAHVSIYNP